MILKVKNNSFDRYLMWLKMLYGSVVSYTEAVLPARHGLAESSEARLTTAVLRTQRAQKKKGTTVSVNGDNSIGE